MHIRGNELIAEGFPHIVAIDNKWLGPGLGLERNDQAFICQLEYMLGGADFWHGKTSHFWRGHECRITVQDGELPGAGIYAFFKSAEAARLAQAEFPHRA